MGVIVQGVEDAELDAAAILIIVGVSRAQSHSEEHNNPILTKSNTSPTHLSALVFVVFETEGRQRISCLLTSQHHASRSECGGIESGHHSPAFDGFCHNQHPFYASSSMPAQRAMGRTGCLRLGRKRPMRSLPMMLPLPATRRRGSSALRPWRPLNRVHILGWR